MQKGVNPFKTTYIHNGSGLETMFSSLLGKKEAKNNTAFLLTYSCIASSKSSNYNKKIYELFYVKIHGKSQLSIWELRK